MSETECEKCGLHHIGKRPCWYDEMREAIGREVSESEDHFLKWLAGWERSTIENFLSLLS